MSNKKFELFLILCVLGSGFTSPISLDLTNKTDTDVGQQVSNTIQPSDVTADSTSHLTSRDKQSKLMQSFLNTSIDPCENFYDYACGNWETINPIPRDKWKHSTTAILQNDLHLKLKELLSEPIVESEYDKHGISAINKAKMFYKTCLEQESQVQLGVESLLKFIKDVGGCPALDDNWSEENFDWVKLAANLSFLGNGVMIAFDVVKNPRVPTENIMFVKQTTLGLVNRDNYMKKENSKNLDAYRVFMKKVFQLLNVDEEKASNVSKEIVDFEVLLANATLPMEATKSLNYYILDMKQLNNSFSYIDWNKYLSGVRGTKDNMDQNIVMQLGIKYFENLYHLLTKTKKRTLSNYMISRFILFFHINLGSKFRGAFEELTSSITGQAEPTPLWKVCVNQINSGMGMATSGMFVKKHFDESSKNETIKMIEFLKEIFKENLEELKWIDAHTKEYAEEKIDAMRVAAGYPEYIRSETSLNILYQDISITTDNHFENSLSITERNWRKSRDRLFKPYDRDQWVYPPTIVNALYDFGSNRILMLASILQPPLFHRDYPQSVNYGAIGLFMAHEMIHGFDDIGRRFDSAGNSFNWWSPKAIFHFEEKQKCFLKQYENLAKENESFKSIATISENLADNGGIRLAYKAYTRWREQQGNETLKNEVFSDMQFNEDQLFFLSFAQTFCAATRPEASIESKSYEAHSPQRYRILGTLMNFEKFADTFQCPSGSKYNPSTKCRLW